MSEETPEKPGAADTSPGTEPTPATTEADGSKSSATTRAAFEVPKWAALALAGLLLLGVGFAIGWVAAPGGGHDHRGEFPEGRGLPAPGGRQLPQLPGRVTPRLPGPGTGSSSGVFLGVATQDATGTTPGAQIATVATGSPADQAGLKAGDIVTAVDGSPVTSAAQLAQQIRAHQVGDQVTITYTRAGASAQAPVKLAGRVQANGPSA
jgi:membrane-associated protease RseP (regulator of RpoE activity)